LSKGRADLNKENAMDSSKLETENAGKNAHSNRWLPESFRGYRREWFVPDVVAGITLAAVAIPACMGYTKIAGMPVVTGLYTILAPILAFALLGSSRHLVVGADSATAAIMFAGLAGMALPESPKWVALASAAAIVTAGLLFVSSLLRLGFLANFLSRTVLVGFLSGVGISLILGELPDIIRVEPHGKDVLTRLIGIIRDIPHAHMPTFLMSAAVIAVIAILERVARRAPGSLIAVALAIGATWFFHLERLGISVVGRMHAGIPSFRVPNVSANDLTFLFPMAISMFLVVLAQSAATSRSFAQKYHEKLNENRDLLALGAANLVAGLSQAFVVNGSPSKTAVAESAGARTQVAQLTTAAVTLLALLFATSLIARMPNAALASLVLIIGVRLIDIQSLSQIYRFRKMTFVVAVATMIGVVFLGVERGIFVAIALSILDHLRQEYSPKDVVLTDVAQHWCPIKAEPGVESAPGLLIYRYEAPLFFANSDHFSERVKELIKAAPSPVKWLVLDLVSMNDIDYTAGLTLLDTIKEFQKDGVAVIIAQAEDVLQPLDRLGITELVGPGRIYASVRAAVTAFESQ
jgi:high affinity sulfate transporter 1